MSHYMHVLCFDGYWGQQAQGEMYILLEVIEDRLSRLADRCFSTKLTVGEVLS